jgi:hypothetical protein
MTANALPVIGVDPGFRWTGAVLRVDDQVVNGFTLGPVGDDGLRNPTAHDGMSAGAMSRYVARIGGYLDQLYDLAEDVYGQPRIAIEMPTPPKGFRHIPLRAWLVTNNVAWAIVGRYDGVVLVPPADHGTRHQKARGGDGDMAAHYPKALCRKRPSGWLPNEAPRVARDHERAAFDVAGVALAALRNTDRRVS